MTSYYYSIQESSLGGHSGMGFFIHDSIPKGATIGYYKGPILSAEDADFAHNFYYMAVNPSGSLLIDGSNPELNPTRFIQHGKQMRPETHWEHCQQFPSETAT